MSNEVVLTFAGDSTKLEQAFDKVGSSAERFSGRAKSAGKAAEEHGNALNTLGEKADNSERNLIGIHDVIDGTATIMQGPGKQGIVAYIQGWADLAGGLAPLLITLAQTKLAVIGNTIATAAHVVWMGIVRAATIAWTAVQWLLNAALLANPIVLIVAGIILLIGVIILIATKTTWFQDIWKAVWGGIKAAAEAVGRWFTDTLWPWIKGVWDRLVDTVRAIPGHIRSAFSGLFNILTAPYRLAFNFIADAWNNTIGRLSWSVPSWVPGIGGRTISVPHLPHFHTGGVVPGAPGSEMLAVLQAGEKVIPAGSSGPAQLTVRFAGNTDSAFATAFMNLIRTGLVQIETA